MSLHVLPDRPERLAMGEGRDARVYYLQVPGPAARAKWRAAVARAGARRYSQLALLDTLRDGVAEVMRDSPPELAETLFAKIAKHRETMLALQDAAESADEARDDEGAREAFKTALDAYGQSALALRLIELEVVAAYPLYAAMAACNASYDEIVGIEAARMFLTDWEGFDEPMRHIGGALPEALLAAIPERHFAAIGEKMEAMTRVTEKQRKNSSSPSATPSGGEISSISKTATNGIAPNSNSETAA